MKCTTLLLPLMAGLAFYAINLSAKSPNLATTKVSNTLSFLENKGQIINQYQVSRKDLEFKLSAGNGLNIFIGSGKVEYQWAKVVPSEIASHPSAALQGVRNDLVQEEESYELYRMDVTLIGANPNARVIKEEAQSYYERYYLSAFPEAGAVASSYRKITYKDIYPHIDWVFYFNAKGQLEHDFVVRPGGKVSDIRMHYGGATALSVLNDGSLQAITPLGSLKEYAPYSYDAQDRVVASRFVLEGDLLSFAVDDYTGILTIDPTLEWGTYFGFTGIDQAFNMKQDEQGFLYLTGATNSPSNIATTGAHQGVIGGGTRDAFITKMDTAGHPVWTTYYGGTGDDRGMDLAIAPSEAHIYIAGYTNSNAGIATTGIHQSTPGGTFDALLVKFDTAGQRIWGTYYGGTGQDGNSAVGLACDKDENIYLCGSTLSTANLSTTGSHQAGKSGNMDAFLAKFTAGGQRLWGTYYGGEGNDYAKRLCTDSLGQVYMIGNTFSTTGISSTGAYQAALGGDQDGFVASFTPNGQLSWATYYGGNQGEDIYSVTTHHDDYIYICGLTASKAGIATSGSYQSSYAGGDYDGFIARFTREGRLNMGTYYGGEAADMLTSLTPMVNGGFAVIGHTLSKTGIATPGYYRDTLYSTGSYDLFFALFDAAGNRQNSSYYGGVGADIGVQVLMDKAYHLYILGNTNSATHISTGNSFQSSFGGGSYDAFVLKMNTCETPQPPAALLGDTVICAGSEHLYWLDTIAGAQSYLWQLPDGWSGASDSSRIFIIPGDKSGVLSVAYRSYCALSDPIELSIRVNPAPHPVVQLQGKVLHTTQSYTQYQWLLNGNDIAGANSPTFLVQEKGSYAVRVTDGEGCEGTSDEIDADGTSIDAFSGATSTIRLYPNPAYDRLFVQSPMALNVIISTIEGRICFNTSNAQVIDLAPLNPGLYLVQLYDQYGHLLATQKLVKQ